MTQYYLRVTAKEIPRDTLKIILSRLHGQGEPPLLSPEQSDGNYYAAFSHPAARDAVASVLDQIVVGNNPVDGLPGGGRLQPTRQSSSTSSSAGKTTVLGRLFDDPEVLRAAKQALIDMFKGGGKRGY